MNEKIIRQPKLLSHNGKLMRECDVCGKKAEALTGELKSWMLNHFHQPEGVHRVSTCEVCKKLPVEDIFRKYYVNENKN